MKIYKTRIRTTVTYAAKTVNLPLKKQLKIFKRKIIRCMMRPKKIDNEYRILMNHETGALTKGENIVEIYKGQSTQNQMGRENIHILDCNIAGRDGETLYKQNQKFIFIIKEY